MNLLTGGETIAFYESCKDCMQATKVNWTSFSGKPMYWFSFAPLFGRVALVSIILSLLRNIWEYLALTFLRRSACLHFHKWEHNLLFSSNGCNGF